MEGGKNAFSKGLWEWVLRTTLVRVNSAKFPQIPHITDRPVSVQQLRLQRDFDSVTLKMEAGRSSETSEHTFTTRPGNPKENHQLNNNPRETPKIYSTWHIKSCNHYKSSNLLKFGFITICGKGKCVSWKRKIKAKVLSCPAFPKRRKSFVLLEGMVSLPACPSAKSSIKI